MIQENRTFNDFFATFPGVTGSTTGYELIKSGSTYVKTKITLKQNRLERKGDGNLSHIYPSFIYRLSEGRDGRLQSGQVVEGHARRRAPYEYVDPEQIAPY